MEHKLTKNVQEESLKTLEKLISYPSVLNENAEGTPFGEDIQACLEATLEECKSLGFETTIDPEGYYGYAEMGSGDELMVVLCHLDVVPADNKDEWKYDPFKLTIADNKLYGRGTQDDKGPSVAALYALKALIDEGYKLDKRVRFVFGTDEENLWRCMDRYNQKEEKATFGFVPDADFPLTYAEKGLLQCYLNGKGSTELLLNNNGAFNVVPDKGVYSGNKIDEVKAELDTLGFEYEDNNGEIIVKGKSVHSKNADEGVNALTRLVAALNKYYDSNALAFITEYITEKPKATGIFGDVQDEVSGPLTVNVSRLIITENETKIGIDMRIPVTADKDNIVKQLKEAAKEYNLTYEEYDYLRSLYVPLDSELVQTLLSVYREMTGDHSEPISSGGATFARTMDNCVAFGARLEGVPVTFHQIDECMPLSNYYDAMEIYAETIKKLACK